MAGSAAGTVGSLRTFSRARIDVQLVTSEARIRERTLFYARITRNCLHNAAFPRPAKPPE
jgi:hypothetical protein